MYSNSILQVPIEGRVGYTYASCTGLKQGCALSLILIGLVPDGLQGYIMSHCPARDSVLEADVKVLISGYGDEFVLLANSPCRSPTPHSYRCGSSILLRDAVQHAYMHWPTHYGRTRYPLNLRAMHQMAPLTPGG